MHTNFSCKADDDSYVIVHCANVTVCRASINISPEDARERNVPKVDGWMVKEYRGVKYAYCGECAVRETAIHHLPKEGF
jgi:hypothetical protein